MAQPDFPQSAKIYQFPVRTSALVGEKRVGFSKVSELNNRRITPVVFESNWYHDAAIREARDKPTL